MALVNSVATGDEHGRSQRSQSRSEPGQTGSKAVQQLVDARYPRGMSENRRLHSKLRLWFL